MVVLLNRRNSRKTIVYALMDVSAITGYIALPFVSIHGIPEMHTAIQRLVPKEGLKMTIYSRNMSPELRQ
jgi:hypothetical protein